MTQPWLLSDAVMAEQTPTPTPVAKERARLNAAALRVLERLKRGPATNVELCHPVIGGNRGIGRVHELREDGHLIEKQHVSGGTWLYIWRGYR